MKEPALSAFDENGAWALVSFLAAEGPAEAVADAYGELLLELYWKRKNLPAVIVVGGAGYQQALNAAASLEASEPERAAKLYGKAKALIYNVASFTWDGWDEPDIPIGAVEREVGLAAAKANLELSIKLNRPAFPLRRGYWMLGAHQLSHGSYAVAKSHFEESARRAVVDGDKPEELLAHGFGALAKFLERPDEKPVIYALEDALESLRCVENGAGFAVQVETARRVFESKG